MKVAANILLNDSHKCNEKRKTSSKKQDIPVPLYTPRIRQTTVLLSWDVLLENDDREGHVPSWRLKTGKMAYQGAHDIKEVACQLKLVKKNIALRRYRLE